MINDHLSINGSVKLHHMIIHFLRSRLLLIFNDLNEYVNLDSQSAMGPSIINIHETFLLHYAKKNTFINLEISSVTQTLEMT